jgi:hypothetical protein
MKTERDQTPSIIDSEFHAGHGRPVNRRDFMSRCAGGFAATYFGLGLGGLAGLGLGSRRLRADDPRPPIPFLVFDLAGGAAMPGNFLVGGAGGAEDLLPSYSTLGWDPRQASALDKRFGLPMAANGVSRMLAGMLSVMSPEAQAGLRFGSILHFGRDDTGSNPLSALTLTAAAGLRGSSIGTPLGLTTNESGGNSESVYKNALYQPLPIGVLDDLLEANGVGPGLQKLPDAQKYSLAAALAKLAGVQKDAFRGRPGGDALVRAADDAYGGLDHALKNNDGLDPRRDEDAKAVYKINEQSDGKARDVILGAVAMNVIKRNAGPGVLTIGGCDYHDGKQATGDQKDLEIGTEIGRAVELACRLKQPLFLQVITDGGLYAAGGSRNWQGDAGNKSMTVLGYYRPDGAPAYRRQASQQIGAYTSGQGVDTTTLVGDKPALAAYAAFANYLNACGRIRDFDQFASGVFTSRELESVLIFA